MRRLDELEAVLVRECDGLTLLTFGEALYEFIDTVRARREMLLCGTVTNCSRYGTLSLTTLVQWILDLLAEEALHHAHHPLPGSETTVHNYCRVEVARLFEKHKLVGRDGGGVLSESAGATMSKLRDVWQGINLAELISAGRQAVYMGPNELPATTVRVACVQGAVQWMHWIDLTIAVGEQEGATDLQKRCAVRARETLTMCPPYFRSIHSLKNMHDLNKRFMAAHAPLRDLSMVRCMTTLEAILFPIELGAVGGAGGWDDLPIYTIDVEDVLRCLEAGRMTTWSGVWTDSGFYRLHEDALRIALGTLDARLTEWHVTSYISTILFPVSEKEDLSGHLSLMSALNYAFRFKTRENNTWTYIDKNKCIT
jgi:hypothetical protein